MKDLLDKMMANKQEKSELSPMEIEAKMDVLKELLGLAESEHGSRVKNGLDEMKKVTVAAPDEKSLEKGLEKAKDIVANSDELLENPEEEKEHEEQESPEKEALEEKLVAKEEESPEEEQEEEDSIFASKRPKSKIHKLMMD
jgi:hypothetical protein